MVVLAIAASCTRAGPPSSPGPPEDLPAVSSDRPGASATQDERPADSLPGSDRSGDGRPAREGVRGVPGAIPAVPSLPAEGERPDWLAHRTPGVREVRALWIVRTSLVDEERARAAVRRAAESGFNTLFVQVRGRGDSWYRSSLEPRADALGDRPGTYDPLAAVLDEAGRLGIAVHAWINVHLVASARIPPTEANHLWNARPGALAVPRALARELFPHDPSSRRYREALLRWTVQNSDRVEGLYTNPADPAVGTHVLQVVRELVRRYALDGLHLDYLRYPSPDFDYSRGSLALFRTHVRSTLTADPRQSTAELAWSGGDPFAYTDRFALEWVLFRRERITGLLQDIFVEARRADPGLVVSVAVRGDADDARNARYQPWEDWLRAGVPDFVVPMAYTDRPAEFRSWIERAVGVRGGQRVWAGVGVYRTSFREAVEQARLALALGAHGTALFSYDWATGPEGMAAASGDYLTRFRSAMDGG